MTTTRSFRELPALACAFGPTVLDSLADRVPEAAAGRLREAARFWERRFVRPFRKCIRDEEVNATMARLSAPFIEFTLGMPALLRPVVGSSRAEWRDALRHSAEVAMGSFPAPSPDGIEVLWYHDIAWCTHVLALGLLPWIELAFPEMPEPREGDVRSRAPDPDEMPLALPFLLWPVAVDFARAAPADRPPDRVLDHVRSFLFTMTAGWDEGLTSRGFAWRHRLGPREERWGGPHDSIDDYARFVYTRLTPEQRVRLGSVRLASPAPAVRATS